MPARRFLLALVAVSALMIPSHSRAASLTLDDPEFASLDAAHVANGHVLVGQLPAFDASLGVLTSVSIRSIGQGSAFLLLDAPEAGFYMGPLQVSMSLLDASQSPLGGAIGNVGTIVGEATSAGPLWLQDGNSFVTTLDLTSGLGGFLAAGAYSLAIQFFGSVSGPGLAPQPYLADSFLGSIRVERVTYTYSTPIPEPSTALLVGLGLSVLVLRRVRNPD